MSDLKNRIESAIRRRDELQAQTQRILGRLDEQEQALERLRSEIRAKNLDPDTLDETIGKLEAALEASLVEFESQLVGAEEAIKPFLQG